VDRLPVSGFDVTIAPLKMRGGSGGPTRVFVALHNNNHNSHNNHNSKYHTPPEPPIPTFHTESSQKVRRVEPRGEPSSQFASEDSTPAPVVIFTAEEYHNNSAATKSSFTCLSSLAIFSLLFSLF